MNFTNMSNNMGKTAFKILCASILFVILSIAVALVWVDFYFNLPMINILWFVLLPSFGLCTNWFIGHIVGDEFYNTGMVKDGDTVFDVKKTPQYLKRRMVVCFVECFMFALLIIRFAFMFTYSIALAILGILCSLVAITIYFIFGMASYEQSGLKNKEQNKESNEEK